MARLVAALGLVLMAPQVGTIDIIDCSRGLSDWYAPRLDPDQVVAAWDVEFWKTAVCGRRNGLVSQFSGPPGQVQESLFVHTPNVDRTDDQLWRAYVNDFSYYNTVYTGFIPTMAPADVFDIAKGVDWATLHGKLFIAAKSQVDRLHVVNSTIDLNKIRRAGLAGDTTINFTVATTGSGTFASPRQYRVRVIEKSGTTIVRRSEPSPVLAFAPPGNGAGALITLTARPDELETHWEVEEIAPSGDWYRIATLPTGTTTYTDTLALSAVATTGVLSDDIGDYQPLYSARWLTVDEDRLILGGSHTDERLSARVAWTPLGGDIGVGNDERLPADIEGFLDFDALDGGGLTGIKAWSGKVIVFKRGQVHQMVRSTSRLRAYIADTLSRRHGALPFSIVEGTDADGLPCLYFLDPEVGPMQLGFKGLRVLAPQMQLTWRTLISVNATKFCNVTYHAEKRQVWWHVATTPNGTPDRRWMYSVESDALVFHTLPKPVMSAVAFLGKPHLLATPVAGGTLQTAMMFRADEPNAPNDEGAPFRAYIRTRAYQMGGLLRRWQIDAGVLEAEALAGVSLSVNLVRDFGVETRAVAVSIAPVGTEPIIARPIDNLYLTEGISMQAEIGDATAVSVAPWVVHGLTLVYSMGSPTAGRG